jgi:A/G-specific adenine glycosylase
VRVPHLDQISETRKISRFRTKLLKWFDEKGRKFLWRNISVTNYQRIIAEILLQRTRAETVAAFYPEFVRVYPSWKKLNLATIDDLQHYLQPIGLWRRRAASIRNLAMVMVKRNGRFPRERKEIEALPGIGQYIANAVLLLCHGEAQPLLDVNMSRVLERVFGPRKLSDIRYDPYLQQLATRVVQCKNPVKLNWAILDLAATICLRRKPHCNGCPLVNICLWAFDHPACYSITSHKN